MSNLLQSPMVLGVSAFMAGWVIAYLSRILGGDFAGNGEADAKQGRASSEHRIRALEADLRVVQKAVEEAKDELTTAKAEVGKTNEESGILRKTLERRDAQLAEAKKNISEECLKTMELRRELTGRAEETIRASVQIKDIETELGVVQAGSDVVAEQFRRLEAEREDLTDRLRAIKAEMPGAAGDESEDAKKCDDLILDS
jgi:chromosome segregation ATPase